MNDPNKLFAEIFCDPTNEQMALMYIASLMSVTEDEEAYRIKIHQVALLRNFFGQTQCSRKDYYLQRLSDIESLLEKDRIIGGWANTAKEEVGGVDNDYLRNE